MSQNRHTCGDTDAMCAQGIRPDMRTIIQTVHMHNESDKTHMQWLRLHTCTVCFLLLILLIPPPIGTMHGPAVMYAVLRFQIICELFFLNVLMQ